jgi:hypothetical protein
MPRERSFDLSEKKIGMRTIKKVTLELRVPKIK